MTVCARCGSASPAGSAACVSCGNPLTTPAAGAPKGQFKQTMLGGAGPGGVPAFQRTQASPAAPAPAPAPAPGPAAPAPRQFGGTMLGGIQSGAGWAPTPAPPGGPRAGQALPPTQPSVRTFEQPPAGHGGTMAGGIAAASPAAVPPPVDYGGTLAGGVSAGARPPAAASPPAEQRAFAGTMLGVPPAGQPSAARTQLSPGGTQPAGTAQPTPSAAPGGGLKQTMLAGGAQSPVAGGAPGAGAAGPPPNLQGGAAGAYAGPTTTGASIPQGTLLQSAPETAAPIGRPDAPGGAEHKRTMLGVAHPGIAPSSAAPAPSAPVPVSPIRVDVADSRRAPRAAPKPIVPKGAWVLIAFASVLVIAGILFAIVYEPPKPVSASVAVDEDGAERMLLTCDDCPDGTTVRHGKASAKFSGGRAAFALEDDLGIGTSDVELSIERPGMGRDEKVQLPVTVAYRIRGDFSGIDGEKPELAVSVEAAKGAAVLVDGKAIELDAQGKGRYVVDVGSELVGPKDVVVPLERKLPYTVTTAGGETSRGEVTVRIGITPLRIDAPGDRIVIESEHFTLAGQTADDGVVTVSGRPITVDASGRFSQLMNVSSVGQTRILVKAIAAKQAPRTITIQVKRVASLEEAAKVFRQHAKTAYGDYALADAAGTDVAVTGRIMDARVDNHMTIAVVELTEGCDEEPCLAKIVYGARSSFRRDDTIRAFGRVEHLVDGPRSNQKIPEIRAEFLLGE